ALGVVGSEARDRAHFSEGAFIEEEIDALVGREFLARALADDARVFGVRCKTGVGDVLEFLHLSEERGPSTGGSPFRPPSLASASLGGLLPRKRWRKA